MNGPASVIVVRALVVVNVGTPLTVVDIVITASTVSIVDHVDLRNTSDPLTVVAGTTDKGVIGAVRYQFSTEVFHWEEQTMRRESGMAVFILSPAKYGSWKPD